MVARRRTLRLKKGGAPESDTPYCDIEFPLELRKWREMGIHEPTLLADYTMSEGEFWKRANRVAGHYEDCSKRVSNDPNSWQGDRNDASGVSHERFSPPTFIQRIYDLNPRKSPHNRWVYDNDNKYTLLRAVREAERQCAARKLKIKKNSNNLTAKNKQNKINAKELRKQYWVNYNRTRKANLRTDEITEIKRYFKSFSGQGTELEGTQDIDFDEINRLLGDEVIDKIENYIKGLSYMKRYNIVKKGNKEIKVTRYVNPPFIPSNERREIQDKLQEYLGHLKYRQHIKHLYNRSNIERNKYYESQRADELSGLF